MPIFSQGGWGSYPFHWAVSDIREWENWEKSEGLEILSATRAEIRRFFARHGPGTGG